MKKKQPKSRMDAIAGLLTGALARAERKEKARLEKAKDAAWIRGYVAACASFSRHQTTPKRLLSAAGITAKKAVHAGVFEEDLIELHKLFPR